MTIINHKRKTNISLWVMYIAIISTFEIYYFSYHSLIIKYTYLFVQLFSIFYFLFIKLKNKKINLFDILVFLYLAIGFISTVNNNISTRSWISNSIDLLLLYLVADWGMRHKTEKYINTLSYTLLFLTTLNTLSAVFSYPNALYTDGVSPLFILGGDNTSVRLYILSILFSVLASYKNNYWSSFYPCLNLLFFSFLRDLGTGKICSILIILLIFIYSKAPFFPKISIKKITFFNGLFFILLVCLNKIQFFSYIIVELLHRDLTLTTRTVIWEITIEKIINHPLLGNGYVSGHQFEAMLPSIIGVNAHNTYLMILFMGGILLFIIFFAFFVLCFKYDKNDHCKKMTILPISLLVLMIRAQVEGGDYNYIIFLLFLVYLSSNIEYFTKGGNSC